MVIQHGGNVGIGVTDPLSDLHLSRNGANYMHFEKRNTAKTFRIGNDNNFIVYGGSNGATGVYLPWGGTSWTPNSDQRVKKNITEITNCLDNISNIRPVYYNYTYDEENQSRRIGFIAQDWKEHYPEVISTSIRDDFDFDVLGLAYTETIPVLCGAIKELLTKVESLEARIESLENSS